MSEAGPGSEGGAPALRRRLPLVLAFLGGLLACAALVLPWRWPAQSYAAWARLRYGAEPSPAGLGLRLRAAAPPHAPGSTPDALWVELEVRNLSAAPRTLWWPERAGEELRFEVLGAEVEPADAALAREHARVAVSRLTLPPGGRVAWRVDLRRYLRFPGPGRYRVRCWRAPFGDKELLQSEACWVELRAADQKG